MAVEVLVVTEGFANGGPSVDIEAEDEDMLGLGAGPCMVRRVPSATPSCVFLELSSSELLLIFPGVLD